MCLLPPKLTTPQQRWGAPQQQLCMRPSALGCTKNISDKFFIRYFVIAPTIMVSAKKSHREDEASGSRRQRRGNKGGQATEEVLDMGMGAVEVPEVFTTEAGAAGEEDAAAQIDIAAAAQLPSNDEEKNSPDKKRESREETNEEEKEGDEPVERYPPKRRRCVWSPREKEMVLKKVADFGGRKSDAVQWFKSEFPKLWDSLTSSTIIRWQNEKDNPDPTRNRKRGRPKGLPEHVEDFLIDQVKVIKEENPSVTMTGMLPKLKDSMRAHGYSQYLYENNGKFKMSMTWLRRVAFVELGMKSWKQDTIGEDEVLTDEEA